MKERLWHLVLDWILGTIGFSVLVALIPGTFLLLSDLVEWVSTYANEYFNVSWYIRVPILITVGFYLNFLNIKRLRKAESDRKKK